MAKQIAIAAVIGAVCAAVAVQAWPASADEVSCDGLIPAVQVDDVRVPDGATCTLDGTTVAGNVAVGRGATLVVTVASVNGNVQATGATAVTVDGSRVGGDVQLDGGGRATVERTRIDGNLQVVGLGGPVVLAEDVVGGDLQPFDNRGGLQVRGNRVGGNLQCQGNEPAPVGGGNAVEGGAEDQCASLVTTDPAAGTPRSVFCDTEGHTFESEIGRLAAADITRGDADGCFEPEAPVTRGQMATFLQRGYQLTNGTSTFCDVAGTVHETAIGAVATAQIAAGGADGCFRPDAPVTRGQMATFLARAERLGEPTVPGFCDTAGSTHEIAIRAVAEAGIARGGTDGCFRPAAPVTRGQMAALLVRALGL